MSNGMFIIDNGRKYRVLVKPFDNTITIEHFEKTATMSVSDKTGCVKVYLERIAK